MYLVGALGGICTRTRTLPAHAASERASRQQRAPRDFDSCRSPSHSRCVQVFLSCGNMCLIRMEALYTIPEILSVLQKYKATDLLGSIQFSRCCLGIRAEGSLANYTRKTIQQCKTQTSSKMRII